MINLIGVKELARHLGISQKALRIRVGKGKVAQPVKREGSELFWDRTVLGNKPLVIDESDNLPTTLRETDALIALQKMPQGGGTTMHIIKGRQPVMDKLTTDDLTYALPTGGLRRAAMSVILAPSPGLLRKKVVPSVQQAEEDIRARGEEPTDDSTVTIYRPGMGATQITLGELKRYEANPVGDLDGDAARAYLSPTSLSMFDKVDEPVIESIYSTKHKQP